MNSKTTWLLASLLLGQMLMPSAWAAGDRTNHFGQYKDLLAKFPCPDEYKNPKQKYQVDGLLESPEGEYCGHKTPARGYWVYVYPDWYIWGKEDLGAAGMELVLSKIKLAKRTITLEVAYYKGHQAWGKAVLEHVGETIRDFERITGIPYPGVEVYRIEESREIEEREVWGVANDTRMQLSPPDVSTVWTELHEVAHIWNYTSMPAWAGEGLPDAISWLLMYENGYEFRKDDTLQTYLDDWNEVWETKDDKPLIDHYSELPQGKAMHFWLMLYQLYGPDFLHQAFIDSHQDEDYTLKEFRKLLEQYTDEDPEMLFSGWLTEGDYQVYEAKDFGTVKYKLPGGYAF